MHLRTGGGTSGRTRLVHFAFFIAVLESAGQSLGLPVFVRFGQPAVGTCLSHCEMLCAGTRQGRLFEKIGSHVRSDRHAYSEVIPRLVFLS